MQSATPAVTFDSLGLSPDILQALKQAGFVQPTPIQAQAIPVAMAGHDVIGCAATGTGKTAAFALPMLEKLSLKTGPRALVLAPTRELALQITEQVMRFGATRGVQCATLIGGVGMGGQVRALRNNSPVIVATPGRLLDHMDQGTARLDGIAWLVLDEADRMLDMGFKPQLDRILAKVPKQRQTMLFSATLGGDVEKFARGQLKQPVKVEVARSGTVAMRVEQKAYMAAQTEKTALLQALLSEDDNSTLVFTRTKRRADKVTAQLERAGLKVARIHADRSQAQRAAALEGFRQGRFRVLVATDIAARGIDVAEIGHVVNYDLPHVPEDYVHRVGRTARASASGRASSLVAPEEQGLLKDIERFTRAPLARGLVPRESPIFQAAMKKSAAKEPGSQGGHHGKHGGGGRPHHQKQGGAGDHKPHRHGDSDGGRPQRHGATGGGTPGRHSAPSSQDRRYAGGKPSHKGKPQGHGGGGTAFKGGPKRRR
ncbi:MAG: DEAD/DEAH box helicase [Myxococcaceae bacterium]|nr:DEAD/DEAH box helicase [Myxococcaceae bacterium]